MEKQAMSDLVIRNAAVLDGSGRVDAELSQVLDAVRHDALAARLVERGRSPIDHSDRQAATLAGQSGGQAHRTGADHEHVH